MAPPIIPRDSLVLLDYVGIAVFAISGALLAAEKKQTLVTFIFFAVATGIGGGTMRDLLIGAPVFWIKTNATLLICIGAGLGVWIFSTRMIAARALLWFDAIGLTAYATESGMPALAGVLLGLLIFKPQFGLAACAVLLATKNWRALAAAARRSSSRPCR